MPDEPVTAIPVDDLLSRPEQGTALCLSGGGYRAMVFHVGVLWRLYEAGLLRKLKRISSVSGGSISAGLLALKWPLLSFDPGRLESEFVPEFVDSAARHGRSNDRCRGDRVWRHLSRTDQRQGRERL